MNARLSPRLVSPATALLVLGLLGLVAGIHVAGVHAGRVPGQPSPRVDGCTMLPSDNIWNTPINQLPVELRSAEYIDTIGGDVTLHPDFGSGLWQGGPIGIPFVTVPGDQPKVPIDFQWADESDPGPYPIPANVPIEGGAQSRGDRHILVLDRSHCVLYEVYHAFPRPDGGWDAGSGAIFNLTSNVLRPETWTSADAAGLPILPGLVRYDELAAGEIAHAIRFTVPETRHAHVWPARHDASDLADAKYPPMGQHFRLRADFDLASYSPQIRVILRAFQRYGVILADNGSPWYISGAPDERWDNDLLRELKRVRGRDFEAVDVASLMVDPDSGQARARPAATPMATDQPSPTVTPVPTLQPTATAMPTATPTASPTSVCTPPPPSLVLSVVPDRARVGDVVTLKISYRNIGLPYTTVFTAPEGLVTPAPPLAMPCKYGEHPTGCQSITYRAEAPGIVTFRASATGEIRVCSNGMPAWTWGGAQEEQPVEIQIIGGSAIFLPLALREAAIDR